MARLNQGHYIMMLHNYIPTNVPKNEQLHVPYELQLTN